MSYGKLILRDSAEIVWPLDDITESSSASKAINFFTKNSYSYSASINPNATKLLKNPIVFGGGTLLSFTASNVGLSIPALDRFSELYSNKESTLSFWFQSGPLSIEEQPILKKRGHDNIGLFIKNNYLIFRYGTSSSYSEVSADIVDIDEPNYIVISKVTSGLSIIINGISYSNTGNTIEADEDPSHELNNYLDFYGPKNNYWNIDCVTIFPNAIGTTVAKRHYVYGLGKNVSDDIFYSRGGNLYNMSTMSTERLVDINWDYKDEWKLSNLIDLSLDIDGIKPINFSNPILYSFDGNIDKNNNSISFSSASITKASFIQIDKLSNKIGGGEYPFFVKVKLDGTLPDQYISQRVFSYGRLPDNEILNIDLYNDAGIYKIRATATNSSSAYFTISNPTSSPTFYVGMKFLGNTTLFFAESGSFIQSASFSYRSNDGYGLDPLVPYFPPSSDSVLRIGSSLNYDASSFTDEVYGVEQFYGSIERFLIMQADFSSSVNFSYIDNYKKSRCEYVFDTNKNRFNIKTYGYGNFDIHSINISQLVDDVTQKIGSNFIKVGYPDIQSSSQVYFYVTQTAYSGSIVYPKTQIFQKNYLGFLNNQNISDTYLTFDFEIYSEDSVHYPPKIKYFQMQTFKSTNNKTVMRDDAGPEYTLYPESSSIVFLPEIRYTPTVFMTDNSGIKLKNNIADFKENILSKPLDPRSIPGLKLWLDARFINGLGKTSLNDDSRVFEWKDLSDNNNHAIQTNINLAPIYRSQSLNILTSNQLNGTDNNDLSFIQGINSIVESSAEGSINGARGIKLTPNNTSFDSYLDVSFNTASISTFPSQKYTIVGSIKLDKPQTASALSNNARKIIVYNTDGVTETFTASSYSATNARGIYSLSATFSTDLNTKRSLFKFYNGSFDLKDSVYWDNLGVYSVDSASPILSWTIPLVENDRQAIKFNGSNLSLISNASSTHSSSLYIVARNFGSSIFLQSTTASILYSNSSSYFVSYGTSQSYGLSNNKYNIFSIINDGTNTELFINGISQGTKNCSNTSINNLIIGNGLNGDISSIVMYERNHSEKNRIKIEKWLEESFDINTT